MGKSALGVRWIEEELSGSTFRDERLDKRLRKLVGQLDASMGSPIPMACADWANAKAAYRFLSNDDVSEAEILSGHFSSTAKRIRAASGPILLLQDTTEFVFKRARPETIGRLTYYAPYQGKRDRRPQLRTVCGLLMHSTLAITTQGLPLGLIAAKFWTRDHFKGTTGLKRRINPTRVPIEKKESIRWLTNMRQSLDLIDEPGRCIHIGDRENDIYEFFCATLDEGSNFIVRTCVDRLAGDGQHTIADEMADVAVKGKHCVEIRTAKGDVEKAKLDLRYKRIRVLPPVGKQKRYRPLILTVIHAEENDPPSHRAPIVWKLITNLKVNSRKEAIEKLRWYALRWKIEEFHKILKSGCRAEDAKLRTAERLVNLIAIFCIMSWRVFWMTMIKRANPDARAKDALTDMEIKPLDQLAPDKNRTQKDKKTISDYITRLACLGGYLARRHDPPPGYIVIWRGWRKLMEISIGYELFNEKCG